MKPATLWLVAGPDGVGKTTFAFRQIRRLTGETDFVNLDEIARGLSPLDPESGAIRASRVALSMIDDLLAGNGRGRRSFSLETTLAGRTHLRTLDRAKAAGRRRPACGCTSSTSAWRPRSSRSPASRGASRKADTTCRRRTRGGASEGPSPTFSSMPNDPISGRSSTPIPQPPKVVAEGSGLQAAYVGDLSALPEALAQALARLPP